MNTVIHSILPLLLTGIAAYLGVVCASATAFRIRQPSRREVVALDAARAMEAEIELARSRAHAMCAAEEIGPDMVQRLREMHRLEDAAMGRAATP